MNVAGGSAMANLNMSYNTMIAAGVASMSYMVHGNSPVTAAHGQPLFTNNYFDTTGARYGYLYPGSDRGWRHDRNYNMVTGALL
jgi:hypothetical protein